MTPPFVIVPYPKANTLQTLIQAYFRITILSIVMDKSDRQDILVPPSR